MRKFSLVLVMFFVFISAKSFAQKDFLLTGRVSAFHKYPVKGVEINAKKAKIKVVTDEFGKFEITCKKRDKLEIKAPGFESVSRSVSSGNDFIEINMVVKDGDKNSKLIVSNGFLREDDLKYGLEKFMNENYDFANYFDIYELVEDRYDGIMIDRSSSVPKVDFRQSSEISSSVSLRAVFQVDGNIRGDLTNIKPSEIASIKLYKGTEALKIAGKEVAGAFVIVLK